MMAWWESLSELARSTALSTLWIISTSGRIFRTLFD